MEAKAEVKNNKSKSTNLTSSLRVKRDFRKAILTELAVLNKKEFGRKIKADDVLRLAYSLLADEHREQLKRASLSAADRIEQKFQEMRKANPGVSKNDFLTSLYEAKFN